MRSTLTETETINCSRCNQQSNATAEKCVHCGLVLNSPQLVRLLGAIFVFSGILNTILWSWMLTSQDKIVEWSRKSGSNYNFTASPEQKAVVTATCIAFLAFGLIMLIIGSLQVKTGKSNPTLESLVIRIGIALWFISEITIFLYSE